MRSACYGVLRFIMESGAKGCEVIVSGKLRAQRAKAMKFSDGYMISSGAPKMDYIDAAVRHVMLRQGVLGIKVCVSKVSHLCHVLQFEVLHLCNALQFAVSHE
jgi:small subunit ribosomal protein S3e